MVHVKNITAPPITRYILQFRILCKLYNYKSNKIVNYEPMEGEGLKPEWTCQILNKIN